MKKICKAMIAVVVCILAAMLVLASGCSLGLNSAHKANEQYKAKENITCLTIAADHAVINMKGDENVENAVVDYYYDKNIDVEVSDTDGVLTITQKYSAFIKEAKGGEITVTLPAESDVQIQISVTAGTVTLSDLAATTVKTSIRAGNCTLTNVIASTTDLALNAGDCVLTAVTAATTDLALDAGKLTLSDCALATLRATVNSGDLTAKKLSADYAQLTVNCGNADLSVAGDQTEYTITPSVEVGNTTCTDQEGTTDKYIKIGVNVGNLTITFVDKPTSAKE
jgi:hypothetical protein